MPDSLIKLRRTTRERITGSVCCVRAETIDDPLMKKIRRLNRQIDDLAKGRPMEKILR